MLTLNSRLHTETAEKNAEIKQLRGHLHAVRTAGGEGIKHDDLKLIRGIGSVLEKRLNEYGIYL